MGGLSRDTKAPEMFTFLLWGRVLPSEGGGRGWQERRSFLVCLFQTLLGRGPRRIAHVIPVASLSKLKTNDAKYPSSLNRLLPLELVLSSG